MSCPICLTTMKRPTTLNCDHQFCRACIGKWKQEKNQCPLCREQIQIPHTYKLRPRNNSRTVRDSNSENDLPDDLPDDYWFNLFLLNQEFLNEERRTRRSTNALRYRFIAEDIKYYSKQLSLARQREDYIHIQVKYIDQVMKIVQYNKALILNNTRVKEIIHEKINMWLQHNELAVREKAHQWKFILEN